MADFETLSSFMDDLEKDYHVRGASVRVLQHGREIYKKHVGTAGYGPVADDTLFRNYSMSKPVTAVCAMTLFEQGKFLLDDPVEWYLPEFKDMKVARLKASGAYGWWDGPAYGPITVRHLLTMTAGITYGGPNHPAEAATDREIAKLRPGYTLRELAGAIAAAPLMFDPGSHWNYSYCIDIVGALIEVWSGMSFYEYLKKAVLDPLGMKDTHFKLPEEKTGRLSHIWEYNAADGTYTQFGRGTLPLDMCFGFESGGAGLISSLEDYSHFAAMLAGNGEYNGVRILAPQTISLMKMNELGETQMKDFDWAHLRGYGYGLGVRTLVDPVAAGSLSPVGEFGWNGLPGPYLLADTNNELAVVYMQQLSPSFEEKIQPRLRNIVYKCLS